MGCGGSKLKSGSTNMSKSRSDKMIAEAYDKIANTKTEMQA